MHLQNLLNPQRQLLYYLQMLLENEGSLILRLILPLHQQRLLKYLFCLIHRLLGLRFALLQPHQGCVDRSLVQQHLVLAHLLKLENEGRVERFRDEIGDWRLCILTPFGARVHAPWAMALGARLRDSLGLEVQSIWSDDGIAFREWV